MTASFQTAVHIHFCQWKSLQFDSNFIEISSQGSFDNRTALLQMMAWRQTGDKPLSEPLMADYFDAYVRHSVLMS